MGENLAVLVASPTSPKLTVIGPVKSLLFEGFVLVESDTSLIRVAT